MSKSDNYAVIFQTSNQVILFAFTSESRKATRNAFRRLKGLSLHASVIDRIELVRQGRVRRAKLYYLRKLRGKAARIRERDTRGERAMAAAAAASSNATDGVDVSERQSEPESES